MKEALNKGAQLVLGFVSAGVAKGVEFDFHCPCDKSYTLLFFFVYLLGPAIAMLIIGILILRQSKDWNFGSRCFGYFFSCLVPPVVWTVMFFKGKFMDCFKDQPIEGLPEWFLQAVCEMELDFYLKRAGGLAIVIVFLIIGLICDCCKKK
ncbi:calcium homeostasis modulator protein 5-like [Pygocentrus nattereri]|uniref:calcium homeostasis modulator protein 5-like n=1 Tax=Pygocentrus nattereri TaxID=42514 RepID=UPI0008148877|nr:calcium homeostasis modulator protein 5-like [Pygocentrus nattereri]